MPLFEEQRLTWKGREYKIPPDKVLRVIARIEDAITLQEIHEYVRRGRLPLAKLCAGWGIALRAAGAGVTDEDVYAAMFGDQGADMQAEAIAAAIALQALMMPPAHLRGDPGGGKSGAATSGSASSPKPSS